MGYISKDCVVLGNSEWENWVAEVAQVFVILDDLSALESGEFGRKSES